MAVRWQAGPGRALGWLPAMAALGCVALAGCGQAAANDATSIASGTAMCANVAQVDRLTINRDSVPHPYLRYSFPAHITITDTRQAQAVARALCTLPRLPRVINCPADYCPGYRLRFAADNRRLSPVDIDPHGCEQVYGQGLNGRTADPSDFWRILGKAAGLRHASSTTFAGAVNLTKLAASPPPKP